MPIIEVKHLYKIFGKRTEEALELLGRGASKEEIYKKTRNTVALKDITLSIEPGETFVVMGLSGSGKSTLVRCLNRLIEPTMGEIWIDGQDVLKFGDEELIELRRFKLSMVFQRFGLLPHRSVLENVAYGLEIRGVENEEREQRSRQWLSTVGLEGWENSHIQHLSGGMQQRVGLARALCTDPEILLMDEPFSALDPLIRREMQNELMDLQGRLKKTIVFITHDLDEALRLGDRIAILKDGCLVQLGSPEEILREPADDYVADFTRDVNRSRIITARTAMIDPYTVVYNRTGPRVALEAMRRESHSSVFVVDRQGHLQGLITVEDAIEASRKNIQWLSDIQMHPVPTTGPDVTLEELLPVAASVKWPLAVIDDQGILLGIIPRVAILAALSGNLAFSENGLAPENAASGPVHALDSSELKPG